MNEKLKGFIDKIVVDSGMYVTVERCEARIDNLEVSVLACGEELSAAFKANENLLQLTKDHDAEINLQNELSKIDKNHIKELSTLYDRDTSRLKSIIVLSSGFFALLGFVAGKLFLN